MEAQQLRRGQAIRVCWHDSSSETGWRYTEDAGGLNRVVSLGYVVNCTPEFVALTTSLDSSGGALDPVGIPWGAITNLHVLDEFDTD